MTDDLYSLDNQWLALVRLQSELPALLGPKAWPELAPEVLSILTYLAPSYDEIARMEAAVDLHEELSPYAAARRRFNEELHLQAALQNMVEDDLAPVAAALGLDERARFRATAAALALVQGELAAPIAEEEQPRLVMLGVGGIDGGKVVRLRNLTVDFGRLGELTANVLLTGADMVGTPHPVIVVAGLFVIIRNLREGITAKLDTDEASVFWGFIQVCGRDRRAGVDEIVASTNQERVRYKLGELAPGKVTAALRELERVGALKKEGDVWELVDQYRITE